MEVRLRVTLGNNAGQEILVPAPKFFVGRDEDCHLRPKSDLISRHHCVIIVDPDAAAVRDLGSRNGTYVNDVRVVGEQPLNTGDRLKIGPLEFEVRLVDAAPKRPKVTTVREAAARTAEGPPQGDLNVLELLSQDDSVTSSDATREFSAIDAEASETEEIDLGQTLIIPTADKDTNVPPGRDAIPAPKGTGKLPIKPPSKGPADSTVAAADVLRKFFQRR